MNKHDIENTYWWLWALLERWRFIIFGSILIAVLSFGIASFFPKWYKAEAEVMPPYRSSTGMGTMANLVTGIMSMGGGGGDYVLPMMTTESDLWSALISSNAMVDTLIEEFFLDERYGQSIQERLRKIVRGHMDIEVTGEGILKICYEAKDQALSAKITNSIVDNLDFINRNLRAGTAGATRKFIEKRLSETEVSLAESESTFTAFQKEHGTFSMEDQTRVAIESASQIEAEIMVAQVELGILESSRKSAHGEVGDVRSRIKTLRKQMDAIKTGEGTSNPFGLLDIPEIAMDYARLFRDLTIQEVLYEYLVQQYEQACIEEKKDTPVLQILSHAGVPQKKDRPRRSVIVFLALVGGSILLSLWILGSEGLDRMKAGDPDGYSRLVQILNGKKAKRKEGK